jgi:hypothetical protein
MRRLDNTAAAIDNPRTISPAATTEIVRRRGAVRKPARTRSTATTRTLVTIRLPATRTVVRPDPALCIMALPLQIYITYRLRGNERN